MLLQANYVCQGYCQPLHQSLHCFSHAARNRQITLKMSNVRPLQVSVNAGN